MYTCAVCEINACRKEKKENLPKNCPILETNIEETLNIYNKPENHLLAYNSALVEAQGYCQKTRVEEIMDFANKCGFKNLGIAFCIGSKKEAKMLHKILTANGFTVNSIACKNGGISKSELGINDKDKINPENFEAMCNPIGQALFLNKAKTDFNLMLNLCVGHDSLFIKYSEAPVTVFSAKDRVMAHNPIGALYCAESYYRKKLFPEK